MFKVGTFLVALLISFNVSTHESSSCVCAPTIHQLSANRPATALLLLDGREFLGTYKKENKEMANRHAERTGAIVRDYGVDIQQVNPLTHEVIKYSIIKDSVSVWK